MESPLKKIKLTPANEIFAASPSTQETKITSTPQRPFNAIINSPNISSISSDNASRSRTSRSIISNASNVPSEDYQYGENYDNFFKQQKRPQYKGRIWKNYKPIAEDSLYAKILDDPANTQLMVTELLLLYSTDPDVVLKELIQFCINVAGFQHFKAKQFYRLGSCEEDSKQIMKKLESDAVIDQQAILKETGRYLLKERNTTLVKYLRMGLYSFIQNLIESAHNRNILYDDLFMKCLSIFIKSMGESTLKCVRHTGVVFAVKILTGIILVFNDVVNNSDIYRSKHHQQRINKLESLIPCFYFIFHKNCRLQDNAVFMMRVECVQEAKIWTKYFPKIFITHFQTVHLMIKLITDQSKEVRVAAVEACGDLMGMPNVMKFLRPIAETLITSVSQRFYDVDIDISVKAINVFTYLIQIAPEFIPYEFIIKMKKLIFDQFAPVGKAACKCLLAYFYKQTKNPENVLFAIASVLATEQDGECAKELLVEGFLYFCDEMQNWKFFCECILSDKVDDEERRVFAEIFAEAVKQRLTGKPTVCRNMSKTIINVDTVVHLRVAEVLGIINIIISNQDDIPIIINMLKIIVSINNNLLEKSFGKEYTDISETIRHLFDSYSDEDLLTHIAEVLQHLCDIPNFAERGRSFAKAIYNEHVNQLREFLKQPSQEENPSALKVAVLYKRFNLNDLISFGELTDPLEELELKTVSHLLTCCKWYLIWSLKNLSENVGRDQRELKKSVTELLRMCKIFTDICFDIFQHSNDKTFIMEVFSMVCDFSTLFTKDLNSLVQLNRVFKELELHIPSENVEDVFAKVLEENVICNKTMSLTERRKHVINYIDIIHYGVLPSVSLVNIFKYFHSYNKDYGEIIEQSLMSMSKFEDPNIIHFIVVHTLITVYETIFKKHGVVELRSEEGVQLKLLAKQFATFKHFHDRLNLFKILCLLIQYAFRDKTKLIFLCIIKCFVALMNNDEDRKKIQHIFNKKVTKELEKNDAVLYFAMVLKDASKTRKSGKFVKPLPPKKKKTDSKENKKPKKAPVKIKSTKAKTNTKTVKKTAVKRKPPARTVDTDSTNSDDQISIHDSESDDIEESMTELKI